MFESKSIQNPEIVYVFDEYRMGAKSVQEHPKITNHGLATGTSVDVKLTVPVSDQGLVDILDDCEALLVRTPVANQDYEQAVNYIRGCLIEDKLSQNDDQVLVYTLDTSQDPSYK